VFVVKADDSVEARKISIARSAGENTVIGEGLKPGERIVVDGQIRLTPGTKVKEFGDAKKEARPAITDSADSTLP
jgi:multidrug efflux system membrane fusion protein